MVTKKEVRKEIQEIASELRLDIWATWYAVQSLFNKNISLEENMENMKKQIVEAYPDVDPEDVGLSEEEIGEGGKYEVRVVLESSESSIPPNIREAIHTRKSVWNKIREKTAVDLPSMEELEKKGTPERTGKGEAIISLTEQEVRKVDEVASQFGYPEEVRDIREWSIEEEPAESSSGGEEEAGRGAKEYVERLEESDISIPSSQSGEEEFKELLDTVCEALDNIDEAVEARKSSEVREWLSTFEAHISSLQDKTDVQLLPVDIEEFRTILREENWKRAEEILDEWWDALTSAAEKHGYDIYREVEQRVYTWKEAQEELPELENYEPQDKFKGPKKFSLEVWREYLEDAREEVAKEPEEEMPEEEVKEEIIGMVHDAKEELDSILPAWQVTADLSEGKILARLRKGTERLELSKDTLEKIGDWQERYGMELTGWGSQRKDQYVEMIAKFELE